MFYTNEYLATAKDPEPFKEFKDASLKSRLPYEKCEYIQALANPEDSSKFITVQAITRTNKLRLPQEEREDENPETANIAASLFQVGLPEPKQEPFQHFERIGLTSDGPQEIMKDAGKLPEELKNTTGSGEWKAEETDYKPVGLNQQYLIVSFWKHDSDSNELLCKHEYTVMNPVLQDENYNFVRISKSTKTAFFFELTETKQLQLCVVFLEKPEEIVRTTIQNNSELINILRRNDASNVDLIDKDGQRLLVYTIWAKQLPTIKFYSLETRTEVWQIANSIFLLELEGNNVWVLGHFFPVNDNLPKVCVRELEWGSSQKPADKNKNALKVYTEFKARQPIFKDFRLGQMQAVLTKNKKRVCALYLKDFYSIELEQGPDALSGTLKIKTDPSMNIRFLCTSHDDLYLCKFARENPEHKSEDKTRELTTAKVTAYDVGSSTLEFPLQEAFTEELTALNALQFSNHSIRHALGIDEQLKIKGVFLGQHNKLETFSYVNSDQIDSAPLQPEEHRWYCKYPVVAYTPPQHIRKKIILVNFIHKKIVRELDLGDWKFLSFIDLAPNDEQHQFSLIYILARDPKGNVNVLIIKVDSFEANPALGVQWMRVAMPTDYSSGIDTQNMVICKLMDVQTAKISQQGLVVQYIDKLKGYRITSNCKELIQPKAEEQFKKARHQVIDRSQRYQSMIYDRDQLTKEMKEAQTEQSGHLVEPNMLVHKQALAGKGNKNTYFIQKSDDGVSESIMKVYPYLDKSEVTMKVQEIYTVFNAQVLWMQLDFERDAQNEFHEDALFFMDSDKKVHRIVPANEKDQLGSHYVIDYTYDMNANCTKLQQVLDVLSSAKWPQVHVTSRSFSFDQNQFMMAKNLNQLEDEQITRDVFSGQFNVRNLRRVRGTDKVIGMLDVNGGGSCFFVKQATTSRAVDCFGTQGPQIDFAQFAFVDRVLFSWEKNSEEWSNHMYSEDGQHVGAVEVPEKDLHPVQCSKDARFYLLRKGLTDEYQIASLIKKNKQYKFTNFGAKMKIDASKNPFHHITNEGELISAYVELAEENEGVQPGLQSHSSLSQHSGNSEHPAPSEGTEEEKLLAKIQCKQEFFLEQHENRITVKVPSKSIDEFSEPTSLKWDNKERVCINERYLVWMDNYLNIYFINTTDITGNYDLTSGLVHRVPITFNLHEVRKTLKTNEMKSYGVCTTPKDDVIQITTANDLILWDLKKAKQVSCVNNYFGVYDDVDHFVYTGFRMPIRTSPAARDTPRYFDINEHHTRYMLNTPRQRGRFYQTSTEEDYTNRHWLKKAYITHSHFPPVIDEGLLSASFSKGDSIFTLAADKFTLMEFTYHSINKFKQAMTAGDPTNPNFGHFQRMKILLLRPDIKGQTPFNIAFQRKHLRCFDLLMNISLFGKDHFVSKAFVDCFPQVVHMETDNVEMFFKNNFVENKSCQRIVRVKWEDDDVQKFYIPRPDSLINEQIIEEYTCPDPDGIYQDLEREDPRDFLAEKKRQRINHLLNVPDIASFQLMSETMNLENKTDQVEEKTATVRMLDFDWVFENNNIKHFVTLLAQVENQSLFGAPQIEAFVEMLWPRYYPEIRDKVFFPFLRHFFIAVVYFTFFLGGAETSNPLLWIMSIFLEVSLWIDIVCFALLEIMQMGAGGVGVYFSDFWNWIDICSFSLNSAVLTMHFLETDAHIMRVCSSTAVAIMWIKLFYWCRLYTATAAFIRMIREIIIDCRAFGIMLFLCVCLFGNTLLILDQSRRIEEIDLINEEAIGVPFIDSIIRSYLVGLGEFGMDNYSASNAGLVWSYFILSTFIIQLVFMNLLIAIMGDTFDRVQEVKEQSSLQEKLQMVDDFIWVCDLQDDFKDNKYVFVVEQKAISGEGKSGWGGKVGKMKSEFQKVIKNMKENVGGRLNHIEMAMHSISAQEANAQSQISTISKNVSELKDNQAQMLEKLTQLVSQATAASRSQVNI